ncbi:MAG: dienelactone hydrolase family protein [Candidatus Eremiobacteraeota bacterium]|nr:dienelactone hydrolase family protein [Candidatus Eremiobacteraeota bacterium]
MESENLTIDFEGASMPAYLSRPPKQSGRHAAIIVLQEIFGVNAEVKRITDLVANAGYVGLAINYYHRTDPKLNEPYTQEGLQRGFAVAAKVNRASLREDISSAIAWLGQQDFVEPNKIATWGFCFGGTVAFLSATLPGLAGAACFYGASIASPMPSGETEALADVNEIRCPLLLTFGGRDDYITREHIDRIESALREAGKEAQIEVYPTVGHAFFRESSHAMGDSRVVSDAWELVQAFFKRVLH